MASNNQMAQIPAGQSGGRPRQAHTQFQPGDRVIYRRPRSNYYAWYSIDDVVKIMRRGPNRMYTIDVWDRQNRRYVEHQVESKFLVAVPYELEHAILWDEFEQRNVRPHAVRFGQDNTVAGLQVWSDLVALDSAEWRLDDSTDPPTMRFVRPTRNDGSPYYGQEGQRAPSQLQRHSQLSQQQHTQQLSTALQVNAAYSTSSPRNPYITAPAQGGGQITSTSGREIQGYQSSVQRPDPGRSGYDHALQRVPPALPGVPSQGTYGRMQLPSFAPDSQIRPFAYRDVHSPSDAGIAGYGPLPLVATTPQVPQALPPPAPMPLAAQSSFSHVPAPDPRRQEPARYEATSDSNTAQHAQSSVSQVPASEPWRLELMSYVTASGSNTAQPSAGTTQTLGTDATSKPQRGSVQGNPSEIDSGRPATPDAQARKDRSNAPSPGREEHTQVAASPDETRPPGCATS